MEEQCTWLEDLAPDRAGAEVGGLLQCLGPDPGQGEKQEVPTQVQALVERCLGVWVVVWGIQSCHRKGEQGEQAAICLPLGVGGRKGQTHSHQLILTAAA